MFTQKTRPIIASILLIVVLACIIHGRIVWDELTSLITAYALPLIVPAEQETNTQQCSAILPNEKETTPCAQAPSSEQTISEKSQIIPSPETVQTVLEQAKRSEKKTEARKKSRLARRRHKKEEPQEIIEIATPLYKELPQEQESAQQIPSQLVEKPIITKTPEMIIPQPCVVHISNKIDTNTLGVKHWTGTYTPTKLEITLNNVPFTIVGENPLSLDAIQEIPCTDKRITVQYYYEFLNGMRKDSGTVTYSITDQTPQLEMRFSWETPWHVELDGAQRVE